MGIQLHRIEATGLALQVLALAVGVVYIVLLATGARDALVNAWYAAFAALMVTGLTAEVIALRAYHAAVQRELRALRRALGADKC